MTRTRARFSWAMATATMVVAGGLIAFTLIAPAARATPAARGVQAALLTAPARPSPTRTVSPTPTPTPTRTATATPTASASPTAAPSPTCPGLSFQGQWYCNAAISGVSTNAYGTGKRVVLRGVSVTSTTTTTVVVAGLESTPCPPGYFCGAILSGVSLNVAWSGTSRPAQGQVINLFGVTSTGTLTPAGYVLDPTGCYIEWC